MFPFDVILFDVGGVLLTNGWDHNERARVLEHFHLDRAAFELRHPVPYDAWERDAIPIKAYLDETVFYEPRGFTHEDFYAVMLTQSKLLHDSAMPVLEELAATQRYTLGALNNEARETNEHRFKHFGLRKLFHVALSSCYLGLRKPEPAIYHRALDVMGKPAARTLFIDDRQENVAAAEAAGMRTIRFEGASALEYELKHLGVL